MTIGLFKLTNTSIISKQRQNIKGTFTRKIIQSEDWNLLLENITFSSLPLLSERQDTSFQILKTTQPVGSFESGTLEL